MRVEGRARRGIGKSPRDRLRILAGAYRGWAVGDPHRYLLLQGVPLPGYTAPVDTVLRARATLGPFLKVFTDGRPSPAVLPVVEQMEVWARKEPAVASWVAQEGGVPEGEGGGAAGRALAGAVLAWSLMHGVVSLEVASQFGGMGHDPRILFEAQVETLADSFGLG